MNARGQFLKELFAVFIFLLRAFVIIALIALLLLAINEMVKSANTYHQKHTYNGN